jgi:putative ABC transport system permease protein
MITGNFFDVLGARPVLGRLLRPSDDQYGARLAAVVSERTWRQTFGGDSSIVGRTLTFSGREATIVGVVGGALDYPHGAAIWAAYAAFWPGKDTLNGFYDVIGRWKSGASLDGARSELGAFLERADEPHSGARMLFGNALCEYT